MHACMHSHVCVLTCWVSPPFRSSTENRDWCQLGQNWCQSLGTELGSVSTGQAIVIIAAAVRRLQAVYGDIQSCH